MRYPEAQSNLGRDFPARSALFVPVCWHKYRSEWSGAGTRMYSATPSSKREITYVGRSTALQVGLCSLCRYAGTSETEKDFEMR